MSIFSKNLFRKDLGLEGKWWHRMAKAVFVIVSIFILFISISIIYELEEGNARHYQIIKSFGDYIAEAKNVCKEVPQGDNSTPSYLNKLKPIATPVYNPFADLIPSLQLEQKYGKLSCRSIIIQSFLSQDTLKDYSLGCLVKNNKVNYLSELSFKEGVSCGFGPEYNCTISENICGGGASQIVKYDFQVKYGFLNYISIALKTLATFVCWLVIVWFLYYKGLLYIIYGGKRHANV